MVIKKRLIIILLGVTLVLFIPFIAMWFSDEVSWSVADFVVMGVLLFVTALLREFANKIIKKTNNRYLFMAVILLLFLFIWAELAVGLFGTSFAGS